MSRQKKRHGQQGSSLCCEERKSHAGGEPTRLRVSRRCDLGGALMTSKPSSGEQSIKAVEVASVKEPLACEHCRWGDSRLKKVAHAE